MTFEERLVLLEETMDIEEGTLKLEQVLSEMEEWDSITKLSIIVMMDDEFDKKITADDFKKLVTVEDLVTMME